MKNMQRHEPRILFLICGTKLSRKAEELFKQGHVPLQHEVRAQGTATSNMIDMLGLGGMTKVIHICMLPKTMANEMMNKLTDELGLDKHNSGIAFTVAITGISDPMMKLMDEQVREKMIEHMEKDVENMSENMMHSLIMATVNQGYSEEVMDAAREAGAAGGTVFHARRLGAEETMHFWGISIQPEREIVLIVASADQKVGIMKAIGKCCGIHSDAQGLVISLPVDHVAGLV